MNGLKPALTIYHNSITVDGSNVTSLTPRILGCITEFNPDMAWHWSMVVYNVINVLDESVVAGTNGTENYDSPMGIVLPNGTLLVVTGIVTLRNLAMVIVDHYKTLKQE